MKGLKLAMEFPFVSVRSHRETLAAKDETIAVLRETIANLTHSLKALEELAEAAKPKMPMLRPRREADTQRTSRSVDLGNLDPSDNEALIAAARQELGAGKHTAQQLLRRAEHIKRQILINRDAQRSGVAQVPVAPPPSAVNEMIEKAIQEGEAAAAAGAQ